MRFIRILVTAVIAALAAMFAGLVVIVALDFMARSLGWTGVDSPSTGWLVLGAIVGGGVGLLEGLRRAGRPVARRQIGIGVVALVTVLSIASATWQRTDAANGPVVRVTAEGLNVRTEPNNTSRIVGSVPRGQRLRLITASESGDWYRVESMGSPRMTGWVGARYVSRR